MSLACGLPDRIPMQSKRNCFHPLQLGAALNLTQGGSTMSEPGDDVEDLEDTYLALNRLAEYQQDRSKSVSLNEVIAEAGM